MTANGIASGAQDLTRYVVTLPGGGRSLAEVRAIGEKTAAALEGRLIQAWYAALQGFAIEIPAAHAERLKSDPDFLAVEEDGAVTLASWAFDRIRRRKPCGPISNWPNGNGAGVNLYVIDSGVSAITDFGNRLLPGYPVNDPTPGGDHGTEVAAIAASDTYGIADSANVVPVRVMPETGYGSVICVIGGVEWVTTAAPQLKGASVALMALVTDKRYTCLDTAVMRSIGTGISYVVAAGNDGKDASNVSPAGVPDAFTVGAIMDGGCDCDAWLGGTNYGAVIDVFAPGDSIATTDGSGNPVTISGTSASSAIVAGVVLLYLGTFGQGPYPPPKDVKNNLMAFATKAVCISSLPSTPPPNYIVSAVFAPRPLLSRLRSVIDAAVRFIFRRD